MSGLKVTHEPEEVAAHFRLRAGHELCCVCFKPTPFWYLPRDIALCEECAVTAKLADLPANKKAWCEQSQAYRRDNGMLSISESFHELTETMRRRSAKPLRSK